LMAITNEPIKLLIWNLVKTWI